jgi:murein L,D-transpeptidase YafK
MLSATRTKKILAAIGLSCSLLIWLNAQADNLLETQSPKVAVTTEAARQKLLPFFRRAGVQFPPQQLALLIFKKNQRLELWAKDTRHNSWVAIRSFSVLAASGYPGPKLQAGDQQVPEGVYRINRLNPHSHFDLSLGLDYPNAFDRAQAKQDGRNKLGGDIFIHGGNRSIGCVAIGDEAIEQLFPLVAMVGAQHVQVIIAPNDFRSHTPEMATVHPQWVAVLYQTIDQALNQFS